MSDTGTVGAMRPKRMFAAVMYALRLRNGIQTRRGPAQGFPSTWEPGWMAVRVGAVRVLEAVLRCVDLTLMGGAVSA